MYKRKKAIVHILLFLSLLISTVYADYTPTNHNYTTSKQIWGVSDNWNYNKIIIEAINNQVAQQLEADSALLGDPVRIATGDFILHDSDLFYKYFDLSIMVNRTYLSSNETLHSLGAGWTFNYDTRIIRGVKYHAVEEVQKIADTKLAIEGAYNAANLEYHSALEKIQLVITEAGDIVKTINDTITALTEALAGDLPSQVKTKLQADLTNAENNLPIAQAFLERAEVAEQDVKNTYSIIENMESKISLLGDKLASHQQEASLTDE